MTRGPQRFVMETCVNSWRAGVASGVGELDGQLGVLSVGGGG